MSSAVSAHASSVRLGHLRLRTYQNAARPATITIPSVLASRVGIDGPVVEPALPMVREPHVRVLLGRGQVERTSDQPAQEDDGKGDRYPLHGRESPQREAPRLRRLLGLGRIVDAHRDRGTCVLDHGGGLPKRNPGETLIGGDLRNPRGGSYRRPCRCRACTSVAEGPGALRSRRRRSPRPSTSILPSVV